VYVRRGVLAAALGGKIGHADLDAAAGAGGRMSGIWPFLTSLARWPSTYPRSERPQGGTRSVSFKRGCGFDLGRRPLEGASGALGAEGLTELRGLDADVGDCLVNGAA